MSTRIIDTLKQRRSELDALVVGYDTWHDVSTWHARTRPLLQQYYSQQVNKFDDLINPQWVFFPRVIFRGGSQNTNVDANERQTNNKIAQAAKQELLAYIDTIIEIELLKEEAPSALSNQVGAAMTKNYSNKVFIVHGHDVGMQQAVARTLSKLNFEPIILSEQANEGQTIIEKFETTSDNVGFAVILFSPDDKAYPAQADSSTAKFRARQNVVLELGYFAAKLGRNRVFVLKNGELEMPSDISGVVYTSYDSPTGQWRIELARELKKAGYHVDANQLL